MTTYLDHAPTWQLLLLLSAVGIGIEILGRRWG